MAQEGGLLQDAEATKARALAGHNGSHLQQEVHVRLAVHPAHIIPPLSACRMTPHWVSAYATGLINVHPSVRSACMLQSVAWREEGLRHLRGMARRQSSLSAMRSSPAPAGSRPPPNIRLPAACAGNPPHPRCLQGALLSVPRAVCRAHQQAPAMPAWVCACCMQGAEANRKWEGRPGAPSSQERMPPSR